MPALNTFLQGLAKILGDRRIDPKWLIAPSLRVGHQWLDAVSRSGVPAINVRVKTIKGLALDLAAPAMATRSLSFIPATGALILVDRILGRLRQIPGTYFASLGPDHTLSAAVMSAISALRIAGLTAADLDLQRFESTAKGRAVLFVMDEFITMLHSGGWADYADVLSMAADFLRSGSAPLPPALTVVLPEDAEHLGLEKLLLAALPDGVVATVPVDEPGPPNYGELPSDASLIASCLAPSEAPPASGDGTANIFRATGEINEVRGVLRRCLSDGLRFDEVELLHTDGDTYIPLIYETLAGIYSGDANEDAELPVTFAEGIPSMYSRPGRALGAWVSWIRDGFPQADLANMIQDGLLELPETSDGPTFTFSAGTLRSIPIGQGRDNYLPKLRAAAETLNEAGQGTEGSDDFRSGQNSLNDKATGQAAVEMLTTLLERLVENSAEVEASGVRLLEASIEFLERLARTHNEMDNYSAQALLDEIREMLRWVRIAPDEVSLDLWEWLRSLPQQVRVRGSGPRPGCIHVASLQAGGHTGRKHTFVIGLDDGRFPGAGLNDPILLDSEREALSSELPKASARLRLKLEKFARLAARLRGTLSLGFSCRSLREDREMFPSPVVFSAYRILSNNREGDFGDMMRWLPPEASFAPEREELCLNRAEWWMWKLCGQSVPNGREIVGKHFPHLAMGAVASEARKGNDFTIYDGRLPEVPPKLDPFSPQGPVMSSRRLETIGQCPLKYFFSEVISIKPRKEYKPDPAQWLDPIDMGNLLHEVFFKFMSDMIEQRRRPLYDRDCNRLIAILDDVTARYERLYPPPGSSVMRRRYIQLKQAALIFLIEEELLCRTSTPMFLEASVGMRAEGTPGPLDTPIPIPLTLSERRRIKARARIDRVDLLDDGHTPRFSLWDYKTGSPRKYLQQDPFRQGRVIQHALYVELASEALKKKGLASLGKVSHFGYFFPTTGSRGLRVLRWKEQTAAAARVMENLCELVSSGSFIATDDAEEDCPFCEYALICGDVEASAAASRAKIENLANRSLNPIRELRNRGLKKD